MQTERTGNDVGSTLSPQMVAIAPGTKNDVWMCRRIFNYVDMITRKASFPEEFGT